LWVCGGLWRFVGSCGRIGRRMRRRGRFHNNNSKRKKDVARAQLATDTDIDDEERRGCGQVRQYEPADARLPPCSADPVRAIREGGFMTGASRLHATINNARAH